MPSEKTIDQYRKELSDDEDIETTFQRLRRDGHSRLEAVRVILDVLDVSLAEAKTLLLTNETWGEAHAATDAPSDSTGHDAYDDPAPPAPAD